MIAPESPNGGALEPPAGPGPAYELPSPRAVVGRGFDTVLAASSRLRRASVYIGLLVLLVVGPAAALGGGIALADLKVLEDLFSDPERFNRAMRLGEAAGVPAGFLNALLIEYLLIGAASIGVLAISVEAQIMGIAILGGQVAGRPLRLSEAILRSRQTFWRVFRAGFLVGVPVSISQGILSILLSGSHVSSEGTSLLSGFFGALVGAPFVYAPSGVVLGDVGAREALMRSVRLARARWRLALVVALFAAVFSSVQVFGLGAGGDVVARIVEAAHLGFDAPLQAAATVILILALVAAIGSLVFTMSAVLAAPQVVAFVGLTHYTAGLDLARISVPASAPVAVPASAPVAVPTSAPGPGPAAGPDPAADPGPAAGPDVPAVSSAPISAWTAAPPPPRFHWISRPMLVSVAAMVLLAVFGLTLVTGLAKAG